MELSSACGVFVLTLCLSAIALLHPQHASTQFTCGDNYCDPGETALSYPLDCGILLFEEDFEDGLVQDFHIEATGPAISVTIDSTVVLTYTDSISASLRGGIGLEAFGSDGLHFDDILVFSTVPQCYNNVKDGDETGIDCGGVRMKACKETRETCEYSQSCIGMNS